MMNSTSSNGGAALNGSTKRIRVKNFWLQPTASFPDGAPQREEYATDTTHIVECARYDHEWREKYECCNPDCKNRDCPQHWPAETARLLAQFLAARPKRK